MPEFDEFGIPIKSKSEPTVDEFGIPIKKKETTVSPSVQKPKPISSGTQPKVTQKPSGTSVSGKPEGLYSVPGNELAVFKKSADGWYVDNNRSGNFIKLQKGDVEKRTAALEKNAKKLFDADYENKLSWEASPKLEKSVITEDQKKQQKEFDESFKVLKEDDPIVKERNQISSLAEDVSKYVSKSEEQTVEDLRKKFAESKYDIFDFEETGLGDMLQITNKKTKQTITIDLDGSENEKNILNAFIESNLSFNKYNDLIEKRNNILDDVNSGRVNDWEVQGELEDVNKQIKEQELYRKGYALSKGTYAATAMYGSKKQKDVEEDYKNKISSALGKSVVLKSDAEEISKYEKQLKDDFSSGLINKDQYDQAINNPTLISAKDDIRKRYEDISEQAKLALDDKDLMEKIVMESRIAKEQRGDIVSNIGANLMYGFVSPFVALYDVDRKAKAGENVSDKDAQLLSKEAFQDALPGIITEEYITSESRSDVEKVLSGVAESIGAALAIPIAGGTTSVALRTAYANGGLAVMKEIAKKAVLSPQQMGLFANSYLNFQNQINSDPESAKIPEADKILLSGAYAYVSSKLESLGMSKWFSKTPAGTKITSWVMSKAFKDLPKDATQEMIDNAVGSSVKALISKGVISLTSKGAIEGTTEALQELSDIGIKKTYNTLKEENVFENPSFPEIVDRLSESFKLGMIGGTLMSGVSQSINTGREIRTAKQISVLDNLLKDPELKKLYEEDIKTKLISGEISKDQAKKQVNELNESIGLLNQIPDNVQDKSEAFRLLAEKEKLNSEIQGKDKSLTYVQINRITEIDNQLKTIGENATKESTKPVEEVTAEGGGVQYQGVKEGQPQVREGERPVGETAQPSPDLGNRPVEGRSAEEEKITSSLESKINQYETEQAAEGIGTEETVTTDEGKEVKRVKLREPKESNARAALNVETGASPRLAVLKYFVGGGKINSTALQKLYGDKQGKSIKGETQSRIGLIDNKKGRTAEQIAESLWMEYGEQFGMNDTDFLPYVEEVISEFKGTKDMISELLSVENKSEEDYYKQMYGDSFEGYDNSEIEQAESVLDYMTDEEIIQMANDIEVAEKEFIEEKLKQEAPIIEEKLEDVKNLDVTDKTNLQKVQSFLDKLDNDLDKFGKETLGINLPIAVAKAVIKTLKTLVNAGVSLEQALKQASDIHNVSEVDIVDAIENVRQKSTEASKSAKKISKPTKKKVTVSEYQALKDQLKLEARAAREAKGDINAKRKMLANAISTMATKGIIKSTQAAALSKRIGYLNLDNPVMVDRFLNYAERVFDRADYQEVLKNAFALRNKIKKAAKSKNKLQAEVAGMAKKFTKIDPSLVEDIDAYMEIADKVYNAIRPVRLTKEGLVTKIAADIAQISEYQTEEIKRQEEIIKKEAMDMHKYLVESGAITSEMSLKEIKDVITILENNPEADVTDRESIIREYVKKAFDIYSGIIIDMVKTGVDPMTGEEISFDEKQKDIIKRLIGIDTDFMKLEDAYKSIEALDNFIVNKITSGVEAIVNSYEGKLNADLIAKSGIKTRPLKLFFSGLGGRAMAEYFASLPVLIDTMFGGINAGQKFMNLSGINDFANGVAKATKEQNNIVNEYGQKFEKSKPNGMDFRAAENVYERGMIAYLSRTIDGNSTEQRQELGRRINIIKDSIESLKDGDKDQNRISEIYQSIYDKLGLDEFNVNNDNLTISYIQSKADKTNAEAVKWWIEKWAEKYSDLSDVSLSVYNTELGSDINYTPDRYSKIEGKEDPINDINLQKAGAFGMDLNFTDKNKTGVLMETTRPKKTPGRYVNLDFDVSNARSMKAALVDINTAASVRKIDGFLKSPSFSKIVEDAKDKKILQRRINSYIRRSKHKAVINDSTLRELDNAFNYVASIGAVKALGGIFQPIKQTVPVMINTIINAGPQNVSFASVFSDSDMHEWINKSGMSIANRGLEASTAIDTANKYLDKVAGSKGEAATKALMALNEFWLKKFLQQPDVWIARSSFISYYKQALRRKGVDVSNIDWKNHPVDKEAANYAQHMVDRQQNVSDAAMMGEIMASEEAHFKIARKTLLPFANFVMNQKSRMYSDFRTVLSKDANKDDKKAAARSLSGLTIELGMYQYLAYMIGMGIKSLAANLVGYEPDDEEEKKNKKYAVQNAANQYIKDVLSPIPLTDGITLEAFNFIADELQDTMISDQEIKDAIDEENKIREEMGEDPMNEKQSQKFKEEFIDNRKYKFEKFKDESLFNLGTVTIALDKSKELWDMIKLAKTGKFTEESFGTEKTKYISKEDQKMMSYLSALKFASLSGALPVEANNLAMYSTKYIKKNSITENQFDKSQEVKKELGVKNLSEYQMALVKSKKKADGILEEINWIENNGGFKNKKQEQAYIKMIQGDEEVTNSDLSRIQSIK